VRPPRVRPPTATTSTRYAALFAASLLACSEAPPNPNAPCNSPGERRVVVLTTFGFARANAMRGDVVEGFDLDSHVSAAGDRVGCRQGDFTSPEGARGVDNQIARLLPIVDSMTGGAFDGLIQSSVNNGQLLVAVQLDGVDDLREDACVTLTFYRVVGMPFVGGDMRIDPDQTFDVDRAHPPARVPARIRAGVLETDSFELPFPVAALDARFTLDLHGARVRARVHADGSLTGVVGGGIVVQTFGETIQRFGIGAELQRIFLTTLRLMADLAPDSAGTCQQISVGLRFESRPAFINP
jgi:hypothetical protein